MTICLYCTSNQPVEREMLMSLLLYSYTAPEKASEKIWRYSIPRSYVTDCSVTPPVVSLSSFPKRFQWYLYICATLAALVFRTRTLQSVSNRVVLCASTILVAASYVSSYTEFSNKYLLQYSNIGYYQLIFSNTVNKGIIGGLKTDRKERDSFQKSKCQSQETVYTSFVSLPFNHFSSVQIVPFYQTFWYIL